MIFIGKKSAEESVMTATRIFCHFVLHWERPQKSRYGQFSLSKSIDALISKNASKVKKILLKNEKSGKIMHHSQGSAPFFVILNGAEGEVNGSSSNFQR